ncbi:MULTISPECIES: hypothetical protein [Streptomyces]|uniref:hypothetical protein n=1 Tax=Streptomyces TaxID=1883 RepID=UPI001B365D8C|nr:hypothetical protein [Streptomyces sp. RK75]MBQ0863378.1 hypothetical protein [Streptomyces sp. RK75]
MPKLLMSLGVPFAPLRVEPLPRLVAAARERVRELTLSHLMPDDKLPAVSSSAAAPWNLGVIWYGGAERNVPPSPSHYWDMGKGTSEAAVAFARQLASRSRGKATHLGAQLAHLLAVRRVARGHILDLKDEAHLCIDRRLPDLRDSKSMMSGAVLATQFTRRASALARALGLSRRDARLAFSSLSTEALIARLLFSFRHRLARLEALPCRGREHRRTPLCSAQTLNAPPLRLVLHELAEEGRNLGVRYILTA